MSYRKAHMAKMIIQEIMCGNAEASYRILPAYSDELVRRNPGTVVQLCRTRELRLRGDDTFGRFFWSFGPSISAFNRTVRPLALIDGTHLRGKYRGTLLAATAIDGNNGLFPLALAVVEAETYESWVWFLHLFRQNFISAGRDVITIGSDRMKGLPRAVAEALPGSYHFYCIHHLSANFHGKFKSEDLRKLFMNAAYSLREGAFKDAMESIKTMSKSAEKWISEIPKQNWASSYFEGCRYNVLTTNAAESFNALLKGARELPIAALVEQTRWKLSDFFQYRQKAGTNWTTRLTPNAEDWLAEQCILAGAYMAHQCGWTVYEVKSKYHVDEVDLEKKTCTCRLFQTMGMPCSHAIAAMGLDQRDPYSYCGEWYHADTYRRTYDGAIYPTLDRSQWPECTHPLPLVLPPKSRRQPGRPKKVRTERGMQRGVHHKCGTCGQLGHNKRSCKNPPIVTPQPNVVPIGPSAAMENCLQFVPTKWLINEVCNTGFILDATFMPFANGGNYEGKFCSA
ncbi:uncharacterized protein LOC143863321 [Tasmannia lanceolata]|uniref:uncharacterized protein LOC143863321 n=1 Tax=Tasmannia lanceolata TaxID=3420 RepID=UPI0040632FE1